MEPCGIRFRQVEEAVRSIEMEGMTVSAETRVDAELFIQGEIDANGLVDRVRRRYRLDSQEADPSTAQYDVVQ